jgi:hypothetical protein
VVECDATIVASNEKFGARCIPAMAVLSGSGIVVGATLAECPTEAVLRSDEAKLEHAARVVSAHRPANIGTGSHRREVGEVFPSAAWVRGNGN